ncbi:MAG TPA: single-stranded DNA-binding protein, partial [Bacteroidales bacterium]|nr:single-stranded DNA-binding protein [Bacteroidales bacterium]
YGAGRADFVVQYFQKGKPIEVVGSLHIDTVKNNDDTYTSYTYIRADEVNFVLSDRKDGNSDAGNGEDSVPRQAPSGRNSARVVRKPVGAGSGRKKLKF